MPRCLPMLTSFFDRFLIDFGSQLGPPNLEKSSPRCRESTIFQKIAFRNRHRFLIDFGANMAPFWLPKSSKILPKIDPKRHQFFDRFLHRFFIDFCSFLEANLGPCWPHFRSKWGDPVACSPLFCWVYVIFRFLGRPGPLQAPCGLDFGGFGAPFWRFLASIFSYFCEIWGGLCLSSFGFIFEAFLTKLWLGMGWWGYAKRKEFCCHRKAA